MNVRLDLVLPIRSEPRPAPDPLIRVLWEGPLPVDTRHKMASLTVVVLAVAEDGFQVALSLAELDPEFGACAALPATRYNGELLARPTLVMPSDQRASRYVRGLARLRPLTVGDDPVRNRGGDPGPERVSGGR